MRLLLLTAGSRGDVVPFLALADRARSEGHEVTVGVTTEFVSLARQGGRAVVELDGNFETLVRAQGADAWTAMRSYQSVVKPMLAAIQRSAGSSILDLRPDVVVHHPKILVAQAAATAVGARSAVVEIVPVLTPTRQYPAAGVVSRDMGRANRWTFTATRLGTASMRGMVRSVSKQLGIAADGTSGPDLTLCPISPALLPRPADWPTTTHLTGPWRPDQVGQALTPELDEFLTGGDVVYAGFGSMAAGDPVERAVQVVSGVRAAGLRAVLAQGWGGLQVPADLAGSDLMVLDEVDHAQVLPRVAAAVHHGGAGTVHAAARAGAVSVVVPFSADQPWWGSLLARRGLGPAPLPSKRLTAQGLAAALREVDRYRPRVARVAEQMQDEDGTAAALRVLQAG